MKKIKIFNVGISVLWAFVSIVLLFITNKNLVASSTINFLETIYLICTLFLIILVALINHRARNK